MPIELTFLKDLNLLHAQCTGRITIGDSVRVYSEFLDHPDTQSIRFVLSDLRRLETLDVFHEGGAILADLIAGDSARAPQPWGIALVVRRHGQFPLLNDLALRMDTTGPVRCRTFDDMTRAVGWLGMEDAVLDHPLSSGRAIGD